MPATRDQPDELFSIYDLRPATLDPRRVLAQDGVTVDLFAGPGGWDEGLRTAGYSGPLVGIEWDTAACATAEAAGHLRLHADVARFLIDQVGAVHGLIASPPCPSFSAAGTRDGLDDIAAVIGRIDEYAAGCEPTPIEWADDRSALTAEPMRWIAARRPGWVALEQVPAVLPIWEHCANILARWGYSAWAGVLNAADYGVPQVRRRAVLIASRCTAVAGPPPSHAEQPTGGLARWVSMADALGWSPNDLVGFPRLADDQEQVDLGGVSYRARDVRTADRPSVTVTEKARSWGRWVFDRPATTIQGDPRVWPPGHKVNQADRDRLGPEEAARRYGDRAGTGAIRVTVAEAGVLQGFRRDYPWKGISSRQYLQAGNAVPPPLAAAVLRQVVTAAEVAA